MPQEDSIFGAIREVLYKGPIDLDGVYGERLQVPQSCVASAEIIKRDAAACMPQRVHKPNGFLNIVKGRCFRNFDDNTARKLWSAPQHGHKCAKPGTITCGQPRDVKAQLYLRMGIELLHRLLEDDAVHDPDQTEMFNRRDEVAARDDLAIFLSHTQQAFEIIDLASRSAYHRLEGKEQAIMAERGIDRRGEGCTVTSRLLRVFLLPIHVSGAPQLCRLLKEVVDGIVTVQTAKSPPHDGEGRVPACFQYNSIPLAELLIAAADARKTEYGSGRSMRDQKWQHRVIEFAGPHLRKEMTAAREQLHLSARDQPCEFLGEI